MTLTEKTNNLLEGFYKGDKLSLAKLITHTENETAESLKIQKIIHHKTGNSYRIGITGPPGAGKSTLVNSLAKKLKERGNSVGIIAVDPTSPFTGGALLGDRIRMTSALSDPDIYMRSMASRGNTGGLARTTSQAADLMDAFGFDSIIIETVGVGQLELDVAGAVDTTVVVLVPEAGGSIQAMKAGLIEIADIFVVNKADREGAELLKNELLDALSLMPAIKNSGWDLPVKLAVALEGTGVSELIDTIEIHKKHLKETNLFEKNRMAQQRLKIIEIIKHKVENSLWMNPRLKPFIETLSQLCIDGKLDPYSAADAFLNRVKVLDENREHLFLQQ